MLTDTLNSAMESGADWDDINEYLTDDNWEYITSSEQQKTNAEKIWQLSNAETNQMFDEVLASWEVPLPELISAEAEVIRARGEADIERHQYIIDEQQDILT
jgi:hypothetical protein